jgi:hypothetical protein
MTLPGIFTLAVFGIWFVPINPAIQTALFYFFIGLTFASIIWRYASKTDLILLAICVSLPIFAAISGYVEYDRATQIAAKYGVTKEEFRDFVDDEGYYPATEEAIKEAIEEVREDLVE